MILFGIFLKEEFRNRVFISCFLKEFFELKYK